MALNDKQERFCREYVIDSNATQAAIRAGYAANSAKVTGSRLLAKANVSARIVQLQTETAEKLNLTHEWVLSKLVTVAQRSMQAEPVKEWDYDAKELVETGEYEFDSRGANQALQLIGKHLQMFDKKDDTSTEPIRIVLERGKK